MYLKDYTSGVSAVALHTHQDRLWLASGSYDNTVRL
jgi:hypothetical protein